MRCKGLFERNKIVIIPVIDEEIGNMMRDVKSYATNHQMTIKTEAGIFVNQGTMRVEKVIRCEVIGEFKPCKYINNGTSLSPNLEALAQAREKRRQEREERNKKIIDDHKNGLSVRDLSFKYKMSRQGIYNILEKELEQ